MDSSFKTDTPTLEESEDKLFPTTLRNKFVRGALAFMKSSMIDPCSTQKPGFWREGGQGSHLSSAVLFTG